MRLPDPVDPVISSWIRPDPRSTKNGENPTGTGTGASLEKILTEGCECAGGFLYYKFQKKHVISVKFQFII